MSMILSGEFTQKSEYINTTVVKTDLHLGPMQCFFRSLVDTKISIIFEVAIEKVPILNYKNNKTTVYLSFYIISLLDINMCM